MFGRKPTTAFTLLRVSIYLLAVLMIFITYSVLCADNPIEVDAAEPGVTDLRDFDFTNDIAEICNRSTSAIAIYPGEFYTSADFSNTVIREKDLYNVGVMTTGDYGTIRMLVKLTPGETYAIAAKSASYAQRLYIDGKEIASVGRPADSLEEMIPGNRRYLEGFYAAGEVTEIIIHYSGFVHADDDGLYPIHIGSVANITRSEQLITMFEGILSTVLFTAMLFMFGLFLFFQKKRYLLWFSLLCGSIGVLLLGMNSNAAALLLQDANWNIFIRIAYIGTCLVTLFVSLYVNDLFPCTIPVPAMRGFVAYCAAAAAFLTLAPTTVFTRYPTLLSASYSAFLLYQLILVLTAAFRKKLYSPMTRVGWTLQLFGMVLYTGFSLAFIVTFQNAILFFGWEYQVVGIIVFLFLNILALTLSFSETEQRLSEAQRREQEMVKTNQMLESLNDIKTEFLGNMSHEMRTPLEVISSSAGLAATHIERGLVSANTLKKLDTIQNEAVRLGKLVGHMIEISKNNEWKLELKTDNTHTMFEKAIAFCAPVCQKNSNLVAAAKTSVPLAVVVNEDGIHQVLLNLILNANRYTKNDTILLASYKENHHCVLTVTDHGQGIPEDLREHVFERGVSGDGSDGYGLAICRQIISEHGGTITVTSHKDKGTTFVLTLPEKSII